MLQAIAAGWHHKSAEQLKEIGDKVGRERIMVLHGLFLFSFHVFDSSSVSRDLVFNHALRADVQELYVDTVLIGLQERTII